MSQLRVHRGRYRIIRWIAWTQAVEVPDLPVELALEVPDLPIFTSRRNFVQLPKHINIYIYISYICSLDLLRKSRVLPYPIIWRKNRTWCSALVTSTLPIPQKLDSSHLITKLFSKRISDGILPKLSSWGLQPNEQCSRALLVDDYRGGYQYIGDDHNPWMWNPVLNQPICIYKGTTFRGLNTAQ